MTTRRVIALVIGCLLVIPGLGMLLGGGGLGLAYALQRDDDGYFDVDLDRLESATVAVTTDDLRFASDPGSPDWLVSTLDADVRLRVANADASAAVFVGIGPSGDVDAYLAGVAHDVVTDVDDRAPVYRTRGGADEVAPPGDQTFWVAEASGVGTQELTWDATTGRWTAVVMNADASPGILADVNVSARAGFLLPLALILLGLGVVVTAVGVVLIVVGASGGRRDDAVAVPGGAVAPGGVPPRMAAMTEVPATEHHPVVLEARLDPDLSRWQWLVKWFLAIPHFIVLVFLWVAFVVLTVVAGFAILFTGRYPRGIFDVNVGVLRWSWRVSYYATTGGLGTDQYPPFSLHPQPGDPASLDIAYPEHLTRWMVLVKWFLAIPHLLIVGLLAGATFRWMPDGDGGRFDPTGGSGLLGILVLVAGIALLFTGRYPAALFGLIVGLNRWVYRVVAYVALMTDHYPPFRLDQGGSEPVPPVPDGPSPTAYPLPAPRVEDHVGV